MRDISLHLSDIVQNSITAGASRVEIGFCLDMRKVLTVSVRDDGCGMSPELLERVQSPFTTTRTTRKVGLGIPLLTQNARLSGGDIRIQSEVGAGTLIEATFHTDSIDCLPVGDLAETMATLVLSNPDRPDFILTCSSPEGEMQFSTKEIRVALGGVSLAEPEVYQWILASLKEEIQPILGGIMK